MEFNGGARDLLFQHRDINIRRTDNKKDHKNTWILLGGTWCVAEWLGEDPLIRELYDGIRLRFVL